MSRSCGASAGGPDLSSVRSLSAFCLSRSLLPESLVACCAWVRGRFFRAGCCIGGLAQLVEHLLCKQGVNGSSPLSSTFEVIDMLGTRTAVRIAALPPVIPPAWRPSFWRFMALRAEVEANREIEKN